MLENKLGRTFSAILIEYYVRILAILSALCLFLFENLAPVSWEMILLLSICDCDTAPGFFSPWATSKLLNIGSHHSANFQTNPFAKKCRFPTLGPKLYAKKLLQMSFL